MVPPRTEGQKERKAPAGASHLARSERIEINWR
jgi:hypothetical protein